MYQFFVEGKLELNEEIIASLKNYIPSLLLDNSLLHNILAILGLSSLAMAIFADVGVTVLVILNSLRLLNFGADGFQKED